MRIVYILLVLLLLPGWSASAKSINNDHYVFTAENVAKDNLPLPPEIPQKMTWALSSLLRTHYILDEVQSQDQGKTLEVYVRTIIKKSGEFTDSYIKFDTVGNRYRIVRMQSRSADAEPLKKPLGKLLDWRIPRSGGMEEKLLSKISEVYRGNVLERQNEGIKRYTATEWQKIRQESIHTRVLKGLKNTGNTSK